MLVATTRAYRMMAASALPRDALRHLCRHSRAPRLAPASRGLHTSFARSSHENPLGLPRNNAPPTMPRRGMGGPPKPRAIPNVKSVIAVSSAKGGVGKSTVAVNLALAMARASQTFDQGQRSPRVGLLDLDIFGPSVPILMGLEGQGEPDLTDKGALLPMKNHGMPCMSMGFLLPPAPQSEDGSTPASSSAPVVWRGLMVMKAVQQLLFDVDWSGDPGAGLDALVIDMPPGTGDVALTLSQLVKVDGAVIVSTPQEVALADARKGVAMFDKVNVPILGMVLNMSHFTAPDTGKQYPLFGSPEAFERFAAQNKVPALGRLPLEPCISSGGDAGRPVVVTSPPAGEAGHETAATFLAMGEAVWRDLAARKSS